VAPDQVILDDALGIFGCHVAIPRTFRIHDANRSAGADTQALALRSVERTVGSRDVQLLHPSLQIDPRALAGLEIRAVGAQADEEMPGQMPDAKRTRCLGRRLVYSFRHSPDDIAPWHLPCSMRLS